MTVPRLLQLLVVVTALGAPVSSAVALSYAQAQAVANAMGLDLLPDANLGPWIPVIFGDATVSASGTSATLSVAGAAGSARLVSPAAPVSGVLATFDINPGSVDSVEAEAFGFVGFRPNGNDVLVNVWAQEFQGNQYWLGYLVREIDGSGMTVRQVARGAIGGLDSWNPEQPVVLGYALVGDELWFFASPQLILSKVRVFGGIQHYVDGMQPQLAVFSTSPGDGISAGVGNVWLITGP